MKILTIFPCRSDSTSWYRGLGVFGELKRSLEMSERHKLEVFESSSISWCELSGTDIVLFQRPFLESHKDVIKIIRASNKPVVVDYDDLLTDIPTDNNFHRKYKDIDYKKNFSEILNMADGVILSTDYMYERLKKTRVLEHDRVKVVTNALNNYTISYENKFSEFNKTIMWRGSSTHTVDFVGYENIIKKIIQDNTDFTFIFYGYCPEAFKKMTNVSALPSQDNMIYFKRIKDLSPSMVFVPLADRPFNRSKSNIAKIEATYAGAVTLSVDYNEWVWSGNKDYHFYKPEEFYKKMTDLIFKIRNKDETLREEYNFNYEYINKHYLLSNINKQRLDFMKEVHNEFYVNKNIVV